MNMTKRVVSFILAAIMLCTAFNVFAATDSENPVEYDEYAVWLVDNLGLMRASSSGNFLGEAYVGYADLADIAAKFGKEVLYREGDELKYKDAVDVFMNIAGYNLMKKLDPYYYKRVLHNDVLDGISYKADNNITRYEMAHILRNILEMNIMLEDVNDKYAEANMDCLEYYFFIRKGTGTVEDDGYASLYGNSEVGSERVKISGKVYTLSEENIGMPVQYLGAAVRYYYSVARKNDGELLFMDYYDDEDSIVVKAQDIIGYNNGVLKYYKDDKAKSASTVLQPKIIRNGERLSTYTNDDFKFESGTVTLKKTGTGRYDLIVIKDYDTFVTGDIIDNDEGKYQVYSTLYENGAPESERCLDLDMENMNVVIYMANGRLADFSYIQRGDVLSIAKSTNKVEIIVTRRKIENFELMSISTDRRGDIKLTDSFGRKYVMGDKYKDIYGSSKLASGQQLELYIDKFSRIAWIEVTFNTDYKIGALVNIALSDEPFDKRLMVQLVDENGEAHVFNCSKKLNIEGDAHEKRSYTAEQAELFLGRRLTTENELVMYKTNAKGELSFIKIFTKPEERSEGELARLNDGTGQYNNINSNKSIGNFYLSANTKFWITTADGYKDAENYEVALLGDLKNRLALKSETDYVVKMYGDSELYADYVLIYNVDGGGIYPKQKARFGVVTDIYQELNQEGDLLTTVEYNKGNGYGTAKEQGPASVFENAICEIDKTKLHQVQIGDIIRTRLDPMTGYIMTVSVLWSPSQTNVEYKAPGAFAGATNVKYSLTGKNGNPFVINSEFETSTGALNVNSSTKGNRFIYGWVYDKEESFIKLTTEDLSLGQYSGETYKTAGEAGGWAIGIEAVPTNALLIEYGYDNKPTVTTGGIKDVRTFKNAGTNCSRVITVYAGYDYRSQMFIINN